MRYLLYLFLTIFFAACSQEMEPTYTILKGQLSPGITEIDVKGDEDWEKVAVDSNGIFTDTFDIEEATYQDIFFNDERISIYLEPGKTASFREHEGRLEFSGANAIENNYLYARAEIDIALNKNFRSLFPLPEVDFLVRLDSFTSAKQALLEQAEVSESFSALERTHLAYDYQLNVAQYGYYHAYFAEDYEPSEKITGKYDQLDLNNEEHATKYGIYRALVMTILDNRAEKMDSSMTMLERSLAVLTEIESPTILHYQLSNALYYLDTKEENAEVARDQMLALAKFDKTKTAINERYDLISKLMPGQPSPTFDYENYAGGNTKLADLAGKYVYIDVWATWCGPCLGEIPSLKKLEEDYHDANIEFVSLSVDELNDHQKWRDMIENRELGGVQLFSDNAWESEFVKSYGIMGIPRFILLDPAGNIVSADVERPGDPAIRERFDGLSL